MRIGHVVSLGILLLTGTAEAHWRPCPSPTVGLAGFCFLLKDTKLSATIRLPPDTVLECLGHRLRPAAPGANDNPTTAANEFVPSTPELAVLVHKAQDVTIHDCVIDGFDFGVMVLETKPGGWLGNWIVHNTINVRTNGIHLAMADATRIWRNRITYSSERGRGIAVEFDSDDNAIVENVITSTDAAGTGLVRIAPGSYDITQTAVMDDEIHLLGGDRPLRNVVIGKDLIQIPNADATRNPNPAEADIEDTYRTDHNLIAGNDFVDLGVGSSCTMAPEIACRSDANCPAGKGPCLLKQNSGVGFNVRSADTTIRGNTFSGTMERGVSFGGVAAVFTIANWYPGTCTGDASRKRLCVEDADCKIAGFPDLGSCTGFAPVTYNGNTRRFLAEDNTLTGTYQTAALFGNNVDTFTFRGNHVEGGPEIVSAVQIGTNGLRGVVERNTVAGAGNALFLQRPATGPVTFVVEDNDLTGYVTAIRSDLTVPTTLGGNYWGACPGLDPAKVLFPNGQPNPNVTDVSLASPDGSAPCD